MIAMLGVAACNSKEGSFGTYGSTNACYQVSINAVGVDDLNGGAASWHSALGSCNPNNPTPIADFVKVDVTLQMKSGGYWYDCSYTKTDSNSSGFVSYQFTGDYIFGRCLNSHLHPLNNVEYVSNARHVVYMNDHKYETNQAVGEST